MLSLVERGKFVAEVSRYGIRATVRGWWRKVIAPRLGEERVSKLYAVPDGLERVRLIGEWCRVPELARVNMARKLEAARALVEVMSEDRS